MSFIPSSKPVSFPYCLLSVGVTIILASRLDILVIFDVSVLNSGLKM